MDNIADLMDALRKSERIPDPRLPEALAKSTFAQSSTATSGLTFYDLEAGAKFLYPVLTPLRNMIPRVSGRGGIQANWRAVTGVNTANLALGVSGGNRGAVQAVSTADYTAAYRGIGIETNVDFEAQYAAQNMIDVRAVAGRTGLEAMMLGEEPLLLGGNGSLALGTMGTPVLVSSITGGSIATGTTWSVICVALTLAGYLGATVAGGVPTSITRTNADASTDTYGGGSSQKSASATTTIASGATGSIAATAAAKRGAVAYAWYFGAVGSELLNQITTAPAATITATSTGTQNASAAAADNSRNLLVFDGLLTQAMQSTSNAYWVDLGGATLTADGASGITQIDTLLKYMWDTFRLSPDTMWVNSQQSLDISKKILAGSANGAFRINVDQAQGMMVGGVMATSYLNRFSMGGAGVIDIKIHPNMPPGTILFTTKSLPYPVNNVGNIMQVLCRQDYYQIEWPLRSRRYEYGVYADEVLQHYAPFSMGLLTGIGAG
jgi:hypothetical protein